MSQPLGLITEALVWHNITTPNLGEVPLHGVSGTQGTAVHRKDPASYVSHTCPPDWATEPWLHFLRKMWLTWEYIICFSSFLTFPPFFLRSCYSGIPSSTKCYHVSFCFRLCFLGNPGQDWGEGPIGQGCKAPSSPVALTKQSFLHLFCALEFHINCHFKKF